jgi:hypothetical protein
MNKLRLHVEDLSVESFATGEQRREGMGTVHAHNHTRGGHLTCGGTCNGGVTCDCPITVDETCLEPCGTTLCGPDTSVTCPIEG